MRRLHPLSGFIVLAVVGVGAAPGHAVTLAEGKKPLATVVIEPGPLTLAQKKIMDETTHWLVEAIEQASGAKLPIGAGGRGPALLLTTAQAQPELAKQVKLRVEEFDAYAIQTTPERVALVGANVYSLRHAVAHLLRELGFRYYAPSPRWHIIPTLDAVRVDLNVTAVPDIGTRKIWYAYGQPDKDLAANYDRWVAGNRLSGTALLNTGHSYGHIIGRNEQEFAKHPEYFALLEDGTRDTKRTPIARKFCYSNPGLLDLVARDRIRLLEEQQKLNPLAYMVSVDPSDGQGTCSCEKCQALGSTTDRVIHLANHVARKLRAAHPEGWVGLYAYSSHRLPPNIEVEPNVYVQVALAFNQTQYTLPELVERWSKKTKSLGLREYYGVEAWDWGLPGRMRGGKPAYHQEWIPFYAARKVNAFNAETNANWGGQMLGLYLAAELMWDVKADVAALEERFFTDCFGKAAPAMKALQHKFNKAGPLQAASLVPMFADLERAVAATDDVRVRARLADLMAYLIHADAYRVFEAAAAGRPERDDAYYEALRPLMTYAWRIRARDVVHYYALARRLCNGQPIQDKRLDFYLARKEAPPVWMTGAPLSDDEIATLFHERARTLRADTSRHAHYSRSFQAVRPAGPDAGPSRRAGAPDEKGETLFRGKLTGYVIGAEGQKITLSLKPTKSATLTVFRRGDEVLLKQTVNAGQFTDVVVELPRSGEYRFLLEGEAIVRASPEAPLIYEASALSPANVDYSGPHYFYVPRGVKQIYVNASVRLSLVAPGRKERIEVKPENRVEGQEYAAVDVPEGADGKVWHTDATTRGRFQFLNIPPLLSLSREKIFVPREVAESDGLTTAP